jgi:hypothetical protein
MWFYDRASSCYRMITWLCHSLLPCGYMAMPLLATMWSHGRGVAHYQLFTWPCFSFQCSHLSVSPLTDMWSNGRASAFTMLSRGHASVCYHVDTMWPCLSLLPRGLLAVPELTTMGHEAVPQPSSMWSRGRALACWPMMTWHQDLQP